MNAVSAPSGRPSKLSAAVIRVLGVLPLISRIVAAVGGGYVLAALLSVAVLGLPVSRPQAVIGGMLGSFAVYAGAVVWVFAVRSATRAWVGLIVAALPLLPFAWSVWTAAAPAASP
jgi:phosphate/sulfate permease